MEEIFASVSSIAGNVWLYGISFLLVLSLLVFIHEWGHYIVARLCGVKVETFSIGFGKELFGRTDKNGTRWKFSLIPLGGYVKMFGDTDPASAGHDDKVKGKDGKARKLTSAERKVAFYTQPVLQRSLIVFAGPAINFLFAILVLSVLYVSYGKPETPPVVTAVEIGSAADKAGIKPHDEILEINGRKMNRFGDIQRIVTISLDEQMEFLVNRDGETLTVSGMPERKELTDRFGFKHERGFLGILGPGNGISLESIKLLNGKPLPEDEQSKLNAVQKRLGSDFNITLEGYEEDSQFVISPSRERNAEMSDAESTFYNALILSNTPTKEYIAMGPITAVGQATLKTYEITSDSLRALWQIVTGTRSATELGGIIRIGAIAGDMAQQGFIALVTFAALLSINLGLINLFPIPLLDGGHLLFYGIEAAKGSPVSDRTQEYAFRFGLVFLVALMAFTNINDIFQLLL